MGWPNWTRVLACSTAASSSARLPPTCSAARNTVPACSARSTAAQPWPGSPTRRAGASRSVSRAIGRDASSTSSGVTSTPSPGSARNSESPASSRAATTGRRLRPRSAPPPWPRSARRPEPETLVATSGCQRRLPSVTASAATAVPAARAGSTSAATSPPAASSASVASTAEANSGPPATARPSSSAAIASSSRESPEPPCSSGITRPGRPSSSVQVRHSSRSRGSCDCGEGAQASGARAAVSLRTTPRNSSCSAVQWKGAASAGSVFMEPTQSFSRHRCQDHIRSACCIISVRGERQ